MFSQPSQQKPGTEMEISRKYLWGTLLSNGLGLYKLGRGGDQQVFEKNLSAKTLPAYIERDRGTK